jgi:hypothetical protein
MGSITTFAQNREPAFALRGLERDLGDHVLFLGRVEAREMLADNLVGFISLEAAGAGVPARDVPRRVEHVDRVIRHALDEQLEPAFRAAARLCGVIAHGPC